jgi:hypothetical protein
MVIGYAPVSGDRPESRTHLLLQAHHSIGGGSAKGAPAAGFYKLRKSIIEFAK